MFKLKQYLIALSRRMWPKVTLFAILSALSALAAIYLKDFIPETVSYSIDARTVAAVLDILAASMLAVTTFSLSTMVTAWGSASKNASPRATLLLMEDPISQNVLATFIGSFIFALVGIVCLGFGVYDGGGRLVLFITTIGVILFIVVTLISWIEHLSTLGRLGETARLVEGKAVEAMRKRAEAPFLGANPLIDQEHEIPSGATPVCSSGCGYIQTIDIPDLSALAEKHDLTIYVPSLPGTFVGPDRPLAYIDGRMDDKIEAAVIRNFVVAAERAYEQDPRFGVCVLSEIAVRSLPPVINDSGTVIDVINRLLRVLLAYSHRNMRAPVRYPRIWVPSLSVQDLFIDAFNPISRDAAGLFEVQTRLQKAFCTLAASGDPDFTAEARRASADALERNSRCTLLEHEKTCLEKIARSWPG